MSSKRRRKLRQQAYKKQDGRCCYCEYPMWHTDHENFSRLHGLQPNLAKYLKCTAEHKVARQDGGRDSQDNVFAACSWCNRKRHHGRPHNAPDYESYKETVLRRVSMGRWHPVAASKKMVPTCAALPAGSP